MDRPVPSVSGADLTELHVLGVRHHGPGSARAVDAALDALDPDVVVIEGPPELDAIVGLAGLPSMQPPIAALVYVPDAPRRASFYPLAHFSPEWCALRWAADHGRPARFADLPAANLLAEPELVDGAEGDTPELNRSDPLAALAAAAGFDDPERWWEDAVELHHRGLDAFAAVQEAMAEVRAVTAPLPFDLVREAAMRKVLRSIDASRVAVVCGAFHAPALDPATWPSATADTATLRGLPKVKVASTWVPWTTRRLGARSGYGAGIESPGWYHHLFTAADEPIARWLVRTARLLRDQQFDTSPAALVEAHRLADSLAALRGRPIPGLTEVLEATLAVVCNGSEVPMRIIEQELLVGDEMGRVPDETPMVPLARDLAALQKRLRLKPSAASAALTLDLRTPSHLERSRLFHRLLLLGIDWAVLTESGRTTGTFKETWTLEWRPELTLAVIEASGSGTTVEAAAVDTVARRAADADIALLCELVDRTLLADLPEVLGKVTSALEERTALQHDVLHLTASVEPLARVSRYSDVRGADVALVSDVLHEIVRRVCVGLPSAASALDDDAAAVLRKQVDSVQRGLSMLDSGELRTAWLDCLAAVSARRDAHGLVVGRAVRLLLDGGRIEGSDAAARLSRALSLAGEPAQAAAFLEGFLAGDALLLLHDDALLATIDSWLSEVATEVFDDLLPLLRRAFSPYQPAERRMIGDHVRRLGTGESIRSSTDDDVDADRAARAQPVLRLLLGLEPDDA
jgi:hypothetical protein